MQRLLIWRGNATDYTDRMICVICGWMSSGYWVVQDASSITNDVCSVESSVPRKWTRTVCPLKGVRSKVRNTYPVVLFKFEKVASVVSTVLLELRTCTCNLSNAVVVVVSAVLIFSQKLKVTLFAVDGIVICWKSESVCVVP